MSKATHAGILPALGLATFLVAAEDREQVESAVVENAGMVNVTI